LNTQRLAGVAAVARSLALPRRRDLWLLVTYHLAGLLMCRNSHRPAVVINMKQAEFRDRWFDECGNHYVVNVEQHKTAAHHAAQVVIPVGEYRLYDRYARLRTKVVDNTGGRDDHLFINSAGKAVSDSNMLASLKKMLVAAGVTDFSFYYVRSMYATAANKRGTRRQCGCWRSNAVAACDQ